MLTAIAGKMFAEPGQESKTDGVAGVQLQATHIGKTRLPHCIACYPGFSKKRADFLHLRRRLGASLGFHYRRAQHSKQIRKARLQPFTINDEIQETVFQHELGALKALG